MKRIVCSILVAALMSTIMVSCTNKTSESETTAESIGGTTAAAVVDIIQYIPGTDDGSMAMLDDVVAEANKTLNKEVGVNLIVKHFPDAVYNTKMQMVINSGEPWDICTTTPSDVDVLSNVAQGAFMDLTNIIKENAPDIVEHYGWENFIDYAIGGKIYTIFAVGSQTTALQFAVQLPILDELKIPYSYDSGVYTKGNNSITSGIKTFEDIYPVLEHLKNKEELLPLYFSGEPNFVDTEKVEFYNDFLLVKNDAPTTLISIDNSPDYSAALDLMHDFYKKGYMRKDQASETDEQINKDYSAGKYATYLGNGTPSLGGTLYNITGAEYATAKIGVARIPALSMSGAMFAISAKSKYPEKALQMMNYIVTHADVFNLLKYGIKDVNYTLGPDSQLLPIEGSGYTAVNYTGTLMVGQFLYGWGEGKEYSYAIAATDLKKILDIEDAWTAEAVRSAFNGFRPVLPNNILSKVAAVNSVLKEYNRIYCMSDSQYTTKKEEFFNKLKTAGIDDVLKEYQTQLNTHVEGKKQIVK